MSPTFDEIVEWLKTIDTSQPMPRPTAFPPPFPNLPPVSSPFSGQGSPFAPASLQPVNVFPDAQPYAAPAGYDESFGELPAESATVLPGNAAPIPPAAILPRITQAVAPEMVHVRQAEPTGPAAGPLAVLSQLHKDNIAEYLAQGILLSEILGKPLALRRGIGRRSR